MISKKVLIQLLLIALTAAEFASAQTTENLSEQTSADYICVLPQAEEFRVKISLQNNVAAFFDNHSTSTMTYSNERMSTSIPEARVLIFVGPDAGGSGLLQLEFNSVSRRIRLSTIETDGTVELLGFAKCKTQSEN